MATRVRGFARTSTSPHGWARARPSPATADGVALRWRPLGDSLQPAESAENVGGLINAFHRAAVERLLAITRFGVAIIQALVLTLPFGPQHFEVAHPFTWAYTAWAAALLILVWRRPRLQPVSSELLHVSDLVWTGLISVLSGGVSSHSYPLFALVVISAGYRWGLRQALVYGAGVVVITVIEAGVSVAGLTPWRFEQDLFILRVGYIVILAVLFGGLAEGQLALRFQALSVGELMVRLSRGTLAQPAIQSFLGEFAQILDARSVALVVHEQDATSPTLWLSGRSPGGADVARRALDSAERDRWLHALPVDVGSYQMERTARRSHPCASLALDRNGNRLSTTFALPDGLAAELTWTTALVALVEYGDVGRARLYVFDPGSRPRGVVRLGFVQSLAAQVGPPLLNFYLLRRLRAAAATTERARVAHELHDGPIQTLLGLELRLEALRRGTDTSAELAHEAEELQAVVRAGTRDLRELIELLHPVSIEPSELKAALTDLVERFGRNSGIEISLEWAAGRLDLSDRQAHDVYRLVQEALVNVRRHSLARRARVRFEVDCDGALLLVEDDGKGLGFSGRMTHEQLAMSHKGPRVLRERVELMGGRLAAQSSAKGTCLELRFPRYAPE
jgi:signal transduction histidine kinase